MYHRAFVTLSAVLISACADPSEPRLGDPIAELPTASAAAANPVAMAAPTGVLPTRADAARPGVAIEDALVRLLPAMEDQSIARELRPLLVEAQRQIERKGPPTKEQTLARLGARLRETGADQEDPDLDAVKLALAASR